MNWLTDFVRPKIRALVSPKKDMPENLWDKCNECEQMIFHRDFVKNLFVCHHCGAHKRLGALQRLSILFGDKGYEIIDVDDVPSDPLKFKDSKKYSDRLKDYRKKTGHKDAIIIAHGILGNTRVVSAVFDFSFMGGSMGMAVGKGLLKAAETATRMRTPLLVIPASGGARMQEGALSLMQMPRSILAVDMVKEAGLPYVTLLTDPTTGGVAASFAMVGDITIAEPKALIGFAGARVIQETMREQLPEGFQRAEYLKDHGMVDMIVPRSELRKKLGVLFDMLTDKHKKTTMAKLV